MENNEINIEMSNERLIEFMRGRPHDRDVSFDEAIIEYIEQVEKVSVDRYEKLDVLFTYLSKLTLLNDVGYTCNKEIGECISEIRVELGIDE